MRRTDGVAGRGGEGAGQAVHYKSNGAGSAAGPTFPLSTSGPKTVAARRAERRTSSALRHRPSSARVSRLRHRCRWRVPKGSCSPFGSPDLRHRSSSEDVDPVGLLAGKWVRPKGLALLPPGHPFQCFDENSPCGSSSLLLWPLPKWGFPFPERPFPTADTNHDSLVRVAPSGISKNLRPTSCG
jgi:hypothetical protein